MRFLIDAALSPRLVESLQSRGIAAVHVRDLDMARAADQAILERAALEGFVVVSRDGDFSGLLARGGQPRPSFVHIRVSGLNHPDEQADLLVGVLRQAGAALDLGAIVTVRSTGLRVRLLPIETRDL